MRGLQKFLEFCGWASPFRVFLSLVYERAFSLTSGHGGQRCCVKKNSGIFAFDPDNSPFFLVVYKRVFSPASGHDGQRCSTINFQIKKEAVHDASQHQLSPGNNNGPFLGQDDHFGKPAPHPFPESAGQAQAGDRELSVSGFQ